MEDDGIIMTPFESFSHNLVNLMLANIFFTYRTCGTVGASKAVTGRLGPFFFSGQAPFADSTSGSNGSIIVFDG